MNVPVQIVLLMWTDLAQNSLSRAEVMSAERKPSLDRQQALWQQALDVANERKKQTLAQLSFDKLAHGLQISQLQIDKANNTLLKVQNAQMKEENSIKKLKWKAKRLEMQLKAAEARQVTAEHEVKVALAERDTLNKRHLDLKSKSDTSAEYTEYIKNFKMQYAMSCNPMDTLNVLNLFDSLKLTSGGQELSQKGSYTIIMVALQQLVARGPRGPRKQTKKSWKNTEIHAMIELICLVALHMKKSPSVVLENLGLTQPKIELLKSLCISDKSTFLQQTIRRFFGQQSRKSDFKASDGSAEGTALKLLVTIYDLCQEMVRDDDKNTHGFPRRLDSASVEGYRWKEGGSGGVLYLQYTTTRLTRYSRDLSAVYTSSGDFSVDGIGIVVSKAGCTQHNPQRFVATGQIGNHRWCIKNLSPPVLTGDLMWGACSCGCAGYNSDVGVSKARHNNGLPMCNDESPQCPAYRKDGEPFCNTCT